MMFLFNWKDIGYIDPKDLYFTNSNGQIFLKIKWNSVANHYLVMG